MSILTLEQRLRTTKIRGAKNRTSTYCFIFKFFPLLSRFLGQVSDRDTGVFLFDLPSDLIKPQHIRRHRSLGSVFVLLGFSFSLPFRFLRLEKNKKGFKIFGIPLVHMKRIGNRRQLNLTIKREKNPNYHFRKYRKTNGTSEK